jgi:hypothetical protein
LNLEPRDYLEIVGSIFLAGGAFAVFNERLRRVEHSLRSNVNGLGTKTNKLVLYIQESTDDPVKRTRLTDLFK